MLEVQKLEPKVLLALGFLYIYSGSIAKIDLIMTEKKPACFVIMPISDPEGYAEGHFKRVYTHIIKPACEKAGFNPIRADDIMTTTYIALDIIKNLLECDMAVCDLSSRNPNVLYELGIRQAFNRPVTLIKDSITPRIFDIQGFRDIEYDHSLRIDGVQIAVSGLAEVLKNTYENRSNEVNSLIGLLAIEPAKLAETKKISGETELILNSLANLEGAFNRIKAGLTFDRQFVTGFAGFTDFERRGELITFEMLKKIKAGYPVFHDEWGVGIVVAAPSVNEKTKQAQIRVEFKDSGVIKDLLIPHPKFRTLLNQENWNPAVRM